MEVDISIDPGPLDLWSHHGLDRARFVHIHRRFSIDALSLSLARQRSRLDIGEVSLTHAILLGLLHRQSVPGGLFRRPFRHAADDDTLDVLGMAVQL